MFDDPALAELLRDWGLLILAPLAVLEGPAVTILAGYLARLGLLDPLAVLAVVIIADLVGDGALYFIGRRGRLVVRRRWLKRMKVSPAQLARLVRRFREQGVGLILFGKLTHYLGFAVLLAAGVARMPFGRFLAACLVATIPKSAVLLAIGWTFGEAWSREDDWLFRILALALAVIALSLPLWFSRRKRAEP